MASVVEAGYNRTLELQQEWNALKAEINALVSSLARKKDDKRMARKIEIERRMQKITEEMSAMLNAARKEVPQGSTQNDSEDTIEEEDQSTIQSEKRLPRHVVVRTYDSTDDEDSDCGARVDEDLAVESIDDAEEDETRSTRQLRDSMRREAIARDPNVDVKVVTVEIARPGGSAGKGADTVPLSRRSLLFGGLRGKIHNEPSGASTYPRSPGAASASSASSKGSVTSPSPRVLSADEQEELKLEASRIEREARKLKKKDGRTPRDDKELNEMASRLSDLAKQLRGAEAAKSPFHDGAKSPGEGSSSSSPKDDAPRSTRSPTSIWHGHPSSASRTTRQARESVDKRAPGETRKEDDPGFKSGDRERKADACAVKESIGPVKSSKAVGFLDKDSTLELDELPDEKAYQPDVVSLRKKTLQGLGAGVASFRTLGHRLAHPEDGTASSTTSTAKSEAPSSKSAFFRKLTSKVAPASSHGPDSRKPQSSIAPSMGQSSADPYSEVTERLARRNEQLGTLNTQSDQMTDGANEMLASVRSLRKRQEKGLFR